MKTRHNVAWSELTLLSSLSNYVQTIFKTEFSSVKNETCLNCLWQVEWFCSRQENKILLF
jgi:hypothetical protein